MTSIQDVPKPAYGGRAVRIRPYWSRQIVENAMQYYCTFKQINFATETLRKYTLDLDWENTIRVIDFRESIFINSSAYLAQLETIRNQINSGPYGPPPENRLVVVFTSLSSSHNGMTIIKQRWLPWVLVDPELLSFTDTLLHEIGHACRLGHYEGTFMGYASDYVKVIENFQAHEIYRSYWCTGPRPQGWWTASSFAPADKNNMPYWWPPLNTPTP